MYFKRKAYDRLLEWKAKYNLEEMPGSCYNKDIFGR